MLHVLCCDIDSILLGSVYCQYPVTTEVRRLSYLDSCCDYLNDLLQHDRSQLYKVVMKFAADPSCDRKRPLDTCCSVEPLEH